MVYTLFILNTTVLPISLIFNLALFIKKFNKWLNAYTFLKFQYKHVYY